MLRINDKPKCRRRYIINVRSDNEGVAMATESVYEVRALGRRCSYVSNAGLKPRRRNVVQSRLKLSYLRALAVSFTLIALPVLVLGSFENIF